MKKSCCWFALFLGAAGCVTLPPLWPDRPKEPPSHKEAAKPSTPVTADQVTESNARDKAKALQEELDREERGKGKAQETK